LQGRPAVAFSCGLAAAKRARAVKSPVGAAAPSGDLVVRLENWTRPV